MGRQATGKGVMKILDDMAANFFYTLQIRDRIATNLLPLVLPGRHLLISHSSYKTSAPHTHRHMPLEPFPAVRHVLAPSTANPKPFPLPDLAHAVRNLSLLAPQTFTPYPLPPNTLAPPLTSCSRRRPRTAPSGARAPRWAGRAAQRHQMPCA